MKPYLHRRLNLVSNVGLALAVFTASLPFGMRAYGHWSQRSAMKDFRRNHPSSSSRKVVQSTVPKPLNRPRRTWETCVVQIPSLGVDAVTTEGAGKWELVMGPGHLPGSAGAGGAGNCVIGAHRNLWDSTFADLPKLKKGDRVNTIDSRGRSTYMIDQVMEVRTDDKAPLRNTRDARLTLITCVLPFDPHKRWVAQGHLIADSE